MIAVTRCCECDLQWRETSHCRINLFVASDVWITWLITDVTNIWCMYPCALVRSLLLREKCKTKLLSASWTPFVKNTRMKNTSCSLLDALIRTGKRNRISQQVLVRNYFSFLSSRFGMLKVDLGFTSRVGTIFWTHFPDFFNYTRLNGNYEYVSSNLLTFCEYPKIATSSFC